MKPTISKKTQASLEQKDPNQPDYYYGDMDAIDRLIYKEELLQVAKPLRAAS